MESRLPLRAVLQMFVTVGSVMGGVWFLGNSIEHRLTAIETTITLGGQSRDIQFADMQARFAALEKAQLAYPPAEKIALLAQVDAIASDLKQQLLASDEVTRKKLDEVTTLQIQTRDKQTAMYRDLAGFKCKVLKNCTSPPASD